MATRTKPQKKHSVREVAEILGLSSAVVRRHCQEGNVTAEYHEIVGTSTGYYTLLDDAVEWLRENVKPRQRKI